VLGKVFERGGAGGSPPSLLKKSVSLFCASTALALIGTDPEILKNATSIISGDLMDTIDQFKLVFCATAQSATMIASSVLTGLTANGLTPHLQQKALFGASFFPI
jgi:hypothetical protein